MMLVSYMIQHYFATPYQMFTEKIITAYGLLNAVDGVPDDDLSRIRYIMEYTDKDVKVSLWKLDRCINPTKGDFMANNRKLRFQRVDSTIEDVERGTDIIELNEDQIQYYLCKAITELHRIVVTNIKDYKEEIKMSAFGDMRGEDAVDKFLKF
jgi:hypothetical protein